MEKLITARENMIKGQIMPMGVNDPVILKAISDIPREKFLCNNFEHAAYCDESLQLSEHRALLSPVLLSKMVSYLSIDKSSNVLDIACGTGYSTAILASLGNKVLAVESDSNLSSEANRLLRSMNLNNAIILNNKLSEGNKDGSPYDVIFINGMINRYPVEFYEQLADNGQIIFVKRASRSTGVVTIIQKKDDGFLTIEKDYLNAPLLNDF